MDEFMSFWNSLPKHFDAKTQEGKLKELNLLKVEYEKTKEKKTEAKYLALRGELIERNLRMCADFAFKYCKTYWNDGEIDDIFSECVYAMERALDDYDVSRGGSFVTVCYKYMQTHLMNLTIKRETDAVNLTTESDLNGDSENEENSVFYSVYDDVESHIAEDFASQEVVKDICRFINSIPNENDREMLKMATGIMCDRKYSTIEIGKAFNMSQSHASRLIIKVKNDLFNYLKEAYPELAYGLADGARIVQSKEFSTNEERDEYIINSYYGLNGCEKKNPTQIARELGVSEGGIQARIKKLEELIKGKGIELQKDESSTRDGWKFSEELRNGVINDHYGLNGKPMLSTSEILSKYGITEKNRTGIIRNYLARKCTSEERKQLSAKRRNFEKFKNLDRDAYIYFSIYGLNGHEKKSQTQLSKEFAVHRSTVNDRMTRFEEYLNTLSDEERAKVLNSEEQSSSM